MKRIALCVPWLVIAVCTVAVAEPRAGLFRTASLPVAEGTTAPISLIGFHHRYGGYGGYGGYGSDCGCGASAPSCGFEPSCGAGPSCGGDYWGGYCGGGKRHHCHLFHRGRGCGMNCGMSMGCGCDMAAPSCGAEPSCGAAPSCGCDSGSNCGCGRHAHFGHKFMCGGGGCGGCMYGCRCYQKPHRHWANGWCGQTVDGYYGGNPVDCSGAGGVMDAPAKAPPMPEAAPEPEPARSTYRPLISPRFTARPIGLGVQ